MIKREVTAGRIAAIVLVTIAILTVGAVLYVRWRIEARWTAMEARVRALLEESRRRGMPRPVLRGRPVPGDARADYEAALSAYRKLDPLDTLEPLQAFFGRGVTVDRPLVDAALAAVRPALDAMQRGTGREGFSPLSMKDRWPLFSGEALEAHGITVLCVYQALSMEESGRLREAMELLLDGCRFGCDLESNTHLDGLHNELGRLLRSNRLAPEDYRQLDRELELLDGALPRQSWELDHELFLLGTDLLRSEGADPDAMLGRGYPPEDPGWRNCFSRRLQKVAAFEAIDRWHAEFRSWEELPWPEAKRRWAALDAIREKDSNPIVRGFQKDRRDSDHFHRGCRAQLRLLRVGAHFRATGEILDLADPFGDRLQTRRTEKGLRISSVGDSGSPSTGRGYFNLDDRSGGVPIVIEFEVPR